MTPDQVLSHPARVLTQKQHHDPRPCEIPPDWSSGYVGPWAHQKQAAVVGGSANRDDY